MKAGFVGLIGVPNAGKSTLLNALIQEKISIVSPKAQTTRRRILGIVNSALGQVVFVDAPGVITNKKGLNRFIEDELTDVIENSDALLLVLPLDDESEHQLIYRLAEQSGKPYMIVASKADCVSGEELKKINDFAHSHRVFTFSNRNPKSAEKTAEVIADYALSLLPESDQFLYPADLITPHSMREVVAELIREQCFLHLKQEIPYGLAVKILKYDESDPRILRIEAEIVLSKENHKAIVLGRQGSMIKRIGTQSRLEIEKWVDSKVYLGLNVKVVEGWVENAQMLKELGYVVRK